MEECLNPTLEKTLSLLEIKKVEIGPTAQKFIEKIYKDLDPTKYCKELLKLSLNANLPKVRSEALAQVTGLLKNHDREHSKLNYSQIESILMKTLLKLTDSLSKEPPTLHSLSPSSNYLNQQESRENKIRELISIGANRCSEDFTEKVKSNSKLNEIWQGSFSPKNKRNYGDKHESKEK